MSSTYTTDGAENCQNSVKFLVLSATSYKLSKADLSTMLFLAALGISNTQFSTRVVAKKESMMVKGHAANCKKVWFKQP